MDSTLAMLSGTIVGFVLTVVGFYTGASLYSRASGQPTPIRSPQPLQFVVKDDSTEAIIDKAMSDDMRRQYEEELENGGGESLGHVG